MSTMYIRQIQHCSKSMRGSILAHWLRCTKEGWWHYRGIVIGTTKRQRIRQSLVQLLSLSTTSIFSPKELCSFHACNNSLPAWNCPLCFLFCILGDKSRRNTLHFFCWYHVGEALLPLYRRGEFYGFWHFFGGSKSSSSLSDWTDSDSQKEN